jgi:hypothetical protein
MKCTRHTGEQIIRKLKTAEQLIAQGKTVADVCRDGRSFEVQHLFLTSLRNSPGALLQLVRDRWSIEGWHWIRDTQLHEDAHRYRGNGAEAMATLRTAALNQLRRAGFQSIRAGIQAVMHAIKALLAMAMRQTQHDSC